MAIVSFNFTKIGAEKTGNSVGKVTVNHNINITNVESVNVPFAGKGQAGVRTSFSFTLVYEPKIGFIELKGELIFIDESKFVKDLLAEWKEKKKIKKEFMERIIRTIISKSVVQGMVLAKEINLPPPIPLPKVSIKK